MHVKGSSRVVRSLREQTIATAVFCAALASTAAAVAADPLYLARPYDELKLDANNNNAVLKVQPLNLPGRRMPAAAERMDELEIELLERPGEKYRVPWLNVVSISFFEELVLAEANQLVAAAKYDDAYPYYRFLETQYPKTVGLKEAVENFLYVQIGGLFRAERDDEALALAVELHRRNPQRPGLSVAYERLTLRLVGKRLAAQQYAAARGLLDNLAARYPATKTTSIAPLEAQLQQQAETLLAQAQTETADGKFSAAHDTCRKMLEVWPLTPGGQQLAAAIREKYPIVSIGVTQLLGEKQAAAAAFDWPSSRTRPLLTGAGGGAPIYAVAVSDAVQTRLVAQTNSLAENSKQPREIVERVFADSAAALRALRRGDVSAVDRISPWELRRLTGNAQIATAAYAVPSLHVLVPSANKPLSASRKFRRAVLYATDREAILRRGLLDGQTIEGCELISGPFPRAIAAGDAYGLGYHKQIEPRPYDPGLAMALIKLAQEEAGVAAAPLVLAHAPEPIARVACQSLARQLEFVGLKITLHEIAAGSPPTDADLLYVTLVCANPAADAWRLLGPHGVAASCSPAMLAELRQLEKADPEAAGGQLQSIHRLAAAELPLIPLWQLVEHYAVHSSLAGVGQRPAALYDNVSQWQVAAPTSGP